MKTDLLIIDPQFDFCDPSGALYVQGADDDIRRMSDFIRSHGEKLNDIHVTLDKHHTIDIAHPIFWKNSKGNHPNPFTIISIDDIKSGRWTTTNPAFLTRTSDYVRKLADSGRYPLCIWPEHCLIGHTGSSVHPELFSALKQWEEEQFAIVDYVTKGSNFWVEHYSAVQAEVPDSEDPSTQLDLREGGLISTLQKVDRILLMGEALSHCVANTVRDIANNFGEENIEKLVLMEDCTSPVPGFETLAEQFINEMTSRGMKISNTIKFF